MKFLNGRLDVLLKETEDSEVATEEPPVDSEVVSEPLARLPMPTPRPSPSTREDLEADFLVPLPVPMPRLSPSTKVDSVDSDSRDLSQRQRSDPKL